MARTTDERFVISLYESVKRVGDLDIAFNRYEIGRAISLNPKGVDTICKLLIQANFIIKVGEQDIRMTPHGEKLAIRLIEEKH